MSYDIRLFRPKSGEDPRITANADLEDDLLSSVLDPAKEAVKRRVVAALVTVNPRLEVFEPDYTRTGLRHIELSSPDGSNGIQLELRDDDASISVPYWHDGAQAEAAFKEICEYVQIIQRETGFVAWDPQRDALFDPAQSGVEAGKVYSRTHDQISEELRANRPVAKKWWEFWKS